MLNGNPEKFFDGVFDALNTWITEFDHFTRVCADHMVMLLGSMRFLKLSNVLSKLVLSDQITSQEQFYGIVQGGARNSVILIFHFQVQ